MALRIATKREYQTLECAINVLYIHARKKPKGKKISLRIVFFCSGPHSSTQIPPASLGTTGHTAEERNKQQIKNTESSRQLLQRPNLSAARSSKWWKDLQKYRLLIATYRYNFV